MHDVKPRDAQAATIDVRVMPEMPPLAWLADLAKPRPTLLCGADVEGFGDGFFEGCWAGDFERRDLDTASSVFGSGAKIGDGRALFVTPSHTLDALYVLHRGETFTVANSLALLVQFAELELPFDFNIGARFVSVRKGVDVYERVVFETRDWTLYRIVHDNFEICDGALHTVAKEPEPRFEDYASYRSLLLDTLQQVARNGSAPARKVHYPLITCCSSGYDSTACAALAAQLGCRRALTLRTARGRNRLDSGRGTAEALGLEVIELERPARARGHDYEEAEFLATGMGGEDFAFLGFGPYCSRTILLTGFRGGGPWNRKEVPPAYDLQRTDISGSSLTEFRLRHGFVNVPVPFIGARRHDVLLEITHSEEMAPYRVGGDYDRPIPRRLVEEQGVRRGTFATSKKAASIMFGFLPTFWSPHTLKDLKRFERRILSEQAVGGARYYVREAARTATLAALYVALKLRLPQPKALLRKLCGLDPDTLHCNHPRYSNMAFLWAVDKIGSRYLPRRK